MNLSPRWVTVLEEAGFQAQHWSKVGPSNASDEEIMAFAAESGFVVITHDLDFGAILAATQGTKPSVCSNSRSYTCSRDYWQTFDLGLATDQRRSRDRGSFDHRPGSSAIAAASSPPQDPIKKGRILIRPSIPLSLLPCLFASLPRSSNLPSPPPLWPAKTAANNPSRRSSNPSRSC